MGKGLESARVDMGAIENRVVKKASVMVRVGLRPEKVQREPCKILGNGTWPV